MASFEVQFVDDIVDQFEDPERPAGTLSADDKGAASRINPSENQPALHAVVSPGDTVNLVCVVDGVVGPLDAALGGDLFTAAFAEYVDQDTHSPPAVTLAPAQSSVLSFVAPREGHYTLVVYRAWGERGRVFVHVSAE